MMLENMFLSPFKFFEIIIFDQQPINWACINIFSCNFCCVFFKMHMFGTAFQQYNTVILLKGRIYYSYPQL